MPATGFSVQEYISKFKSGARAYLFWVQINFPGFAQIAQSILQGGLSPGLDTNMSINQLKDIGAGAITGASLSMVDILALNRGTSDFSYFVKATSLPEATLNEINSSWVGHQYKLAAGHAYGDWTVTFIVDTDAKILTKFYDWQNIIHNPQTNLFGRPVNYMADQEVRLIGLDGEVIAVYRMYGAWPKVVNAVTLDYGTAEFATVDVTFAYQYHTVDTQSIGILKTQAKKALRSFISGV
jgi:hypothetical protein